MKILFLSRGDMTDYQNDCAFIGLVEMFGDDVTDVPRLWYLEKDVTQDQKNFIARHMHGKGFTITGVLPDRKNVDRTNIEDKIKNHFFDIIVYGSHARCLTHLDIVSKVYKKNEICMINGEDNELIDFGLANNYTYFKREIGNHEYQNVYPISFGFPIEKIPSSYAEKDKFLSLVIPNFNFKYDFNNESDYYNEYQRSMFAMTFKKGGWDCMRHYEIIFNGCLPFFRDIEQKPKMTMVNYPVNLQLKANEMYNKKDTTNYYELREEFLSYANKNLTCVAVANYILDKVR